jgi:dipeptidyl aminopeptidase/acylaminoacyl peptidase
MSDSPQLTTAPYGTWPSTITPALLVEGSVGLSDLSVCARRAYWVEARPADAGRQVLVSVELAGGEPTDVIPAGFSVRTLVHEYGGRCYVVDGSRVVFSNWDDQRLWMVLDGSDPFPLTAAPDVPRSVRYADPTATPDGRWVVCVRETHGGIGGVVNDLVAVPLDAPPGEASPVVLASGHDFYASPRPSPDGATLAWVSWDHPDMPWDASRLSVASLSGAVPRLGEEKIVAGGPGISVGQPRFSPAGVLHFTSDESGWWNIHDEHGANLCRIDADFAEPDWVFGQTRYGFADDGAMVATWSSLGTEHIGHVRDSTAHEVSFPYTHYSSVTPAGDAVLAIAASPVVPPAVVWMDLTSGRSRVVRASRDLPVDAAEISAPRHVEFPTAGGATAHALYYAPRSSRFTGPTSERPPVVVTIHGGPTSSALPVFNARVQYWTNRGFGVADVDYRGSSGYGREYRNQLEGQWGVADVEDCAAVVAWLENEGLADGRRAVIRGGSAGGFTTLAALAFTDAFAGGASHYGVADLELLGRETHKFEARYLDSLVGPWPEAADEYRRRSPIHHIEGITSPLILFQGLEDVVVPPSQSQLIYDALRDRGVPVAYMAFPGEQHGFRMAETVITVMDAELRFYGRVLGFEPSGLEDDARALDIANEDALSPRG